MRKREIEKLENILKEGPKSLSQAWILAALRRKHKQLFDNDSKNNSIQK